VTYESPIAMIAEKMATEIAEKFDGEVLTAIRKYHVDVNKDELVKALAYDRGQYEKGYADGFADGLAADRWVSVKDRLPTVMDLICWVMIKGCPKPLIDCWEGDRGEESTGVFPDGEKTYVKSGWYYNECNEVTHWMPIPQPEPPEEVDPE